MAKLGTRVKHFATGHEGAVVQVKDDMCLIEFDRSGGGGFQMYRQSEIGDPSRNSQHFLYDMESMSFLRES